MNNMYYPSHDTSTTKINIDELDYAKFSEKNRDDVETSLFKIQKIFHLKSYLLLRILKKEK